VVVDTSVWIAYFRDPATPYGDCLEGLMEAREAYVAGPIVYEVLQGTRTSGEFEEFRLLLEKLPCLAISGRTWVSAAGMAAGLRRRGLSFPMTDLVIATLAGEHRCQIWSNDGHFQEIPGVRLYHPPRRSHRLA
jgi:hypothetical protein